MSDLWREWRGGSCATHPQAKVRLRYRGVDAFFESKWEYPAGRMRWTHKDEPGDIIAYQVVDIPPEAAE